MLMTHRKREGKGGTEETNRQTEIDRDDKEEEDVDDDVNDDDDEEDKKRR